MMESIDSFNQKVSSVEERITISLDLERLQTENIALCKFADVVILSKEFALHLGYANKTDAVNKFRQLTRTGLVCCLFCVLYSVCQLLFTSRNIIVCPWGTDGVAALDSVDNLSTAEAYPPDLVVDTLGAGDTFAAALIFALSRNYSVSKGIEFASRLAGFKVGFYGYDQIHEHLENLL